MIDDFDDEDDARFSNNLVNARDKRNSTKMRRVDDQDDHSR